MTEGYAEEGRRVAILGADAGTLADLAGHLSDVGIDVALIEDPGQLAGAPVTNLIIAETFSPGLDWTHWSEREHGTWAVLTAALPHMASLSTAIFVAFVPSDDKKERREVRAALSRIISSLGAEASMAFGIDFTANGMDVPKSASRDVLEWRLIEFVKRRSNLSTGVVLSFEAIEDESIMSALSEISI